VVSDCLVTVSEIQVEDGPAGKVLSEGIQGILQGQTLKEYNKKFVEQSSSSGILHCLVGLEMDIILDPYHKTSNLEVIATYPDKPALADCKIVHLALLGLILDSPETALIWKQKCAEWHPRSSYFEGNLVTNIDGRL